MKLGFNNLGPIYQGEIELANLTILCGENNTGKTYITNSLYSFLYNWENIIAWDMPKQTLADLEADGVAKIELEQAIVQQWSDICLETMSVLKNKLHDFLATSSERFEKTIFTLSTPIETGWITSDFDREFKSSKGKPLISIKKPAGQTVAEIAFIQEQGDETPPIFVLENFIQSQLLEIVLSNTFPSVFIASAERTGASIFKNELNFSKNRLVGILAEIEKDNKKFDPFTLFREFKRNYAISVEHNVEFISDSPNLEQRGRSEFIKKNNDILIKFQEIAGGVYKTTKEGGIYFYPTGAKGVRLALGEASSAVRSMMILWYWLNYEAKTNSILMIDEPELNLHPKNLRRFARFIAALVNAGIKVFLTTHSDYIIREFNSLIMLSSDKPHIKKVKEKFGYQQNELLNARQVAVYNTTTALFEVEGLKTKKRLGTLERWKIEEHHGIKIKSFDDEIREMNKIQDALLYGV